MFGDRELIRFEDMAKVVTVISENVRFFIDGHARSVDG